MHSVDDETADIVDRYRAAYDKADGADEEQPESYEEVAAWLVHEFLWFGRVAWAAMNPLRPLSAEVLIEAGDAGTEILHNILPELRRFGEAILTQGDPSRLGELMGLGDRVRQEQALFEEAMQRAARKGTIEDARHLASALGEILGVLDGKQRRAILAKLQAVLDRE